jgi:hypothetical protein
MFILSQYILKHLNICNFTDITTYSIAIGLIIYTSIYLYLLFYNNELLSIFNKFIIYIISIDLLLSTFYYLNNETQYNCENINPENIKLIEDTDSCHIPHLNDCESYDDDSENDTEMEEDSENIDLEDDSDIETEQIVDNTEIDITNDNIDTFTENITSLDNNKVESSTYIPNLNSEILQTEPIQSESQPTFTENIDLEMSHIQPKDNIDISSEPIKKRRGRKPNSLKL